MGNVIGFLETENQCKKIWEILKKNICKGIGAILYSESKVSLLTSLLLL